MSADVSAESTWAANSTPGVEHVLRILAHRDDAAARVVVGDEMNVRELRDGVTHALVDAPADVAALDVRDRPVQIRSRHCNRQLFEPIAADDDDVRIERVNPVRELERSQTCRLRHRHVIAAFDHVEERRRDGKAAGLDVFGDVTAVLVEQDRTAEDQFEIDPRIGMQLAEEQLTPSVVRAVRDRKADPPLLAPRNLSACRGQQGCHQAVLTRGRGRGSPRRFSIRSTRRALRCPALGIRCPSS
jgi:hypothetical protein